MLSLSLPSLLVLLLGFAHGQVPAQPQTAQQAQAALTGFQAMVAAAVQAAQSPIVFSSNVQLDINGKLPSTPLTFKLKAPPQGGDVALYWQAANYRFDKCKTVFTKANWNQEQTVQVTPLPYFSKDFDVRTDSLFMGIPKNPADQATWAKNVTLPFVRSKDVGGICKMFNDPHWQTFDMKNFDVMLSDCFTMMYSDNLIIQVKTVPHDTHITLGREVAVWYNGNILYWDATKNCSVASADQLSVMGVQMEPPPGTVNNDPNTATYHGEFHFPDGACVKMTNNMQSASDQKYALNVEVNLPTHYFKRVKGLCGNFDGDSSNDDQTPDGQKVNPGAGGVAYAGMNDLGVAWKCTPELNLFDCKLNCPGLPKVNIIPGSGDCDITTAVASDTPTGYNVTPPQAMAYAGSDPTPIIPAQPAPIVPYMQQQAEAACNQTFAPEPICKDKYLPQDVYLKACLLDAMKAQSLAFTEGNRGAYMSALNTKLKPIATDTTNTAAASDAIACRKKLGFGNSQCPKDCTSDQNGQCTAAGCVCNPGFSSQDCSIFLGVPNNAMAAAAPAPQAAAVSQPVAPTAMPMVSTLSGDCDIANFDQQFNATSPDQCHVVTGNPGIFDDDGDAQKVTSSLATTCCSRKPGTYCLYVNGQRGANVRCTGTNGPDDNKFSMTCLTGYNNPGSCYPLPNDADKKGTCTSKKTPFGQAAAQFDRPPCDYFPTVPAGQKRFFCAGKLGSDLLTCPDNTVSSCAGGCMSKFEQDGKTPCGKAACAKSQGY